MTVIIYQLELAPEDAETFESAIGSRDSAISRRLSEFIGLVSRRGVVKSISILKDETASPNSYSLIFWIDGPEIPLALEDMLKSAGTFPPSAKLSLPRRYTEIAEWPVSD